MKTIVYMFLILIAVYVLIGVKRSADDLRPNGTFDFSYENIKTFTIDTLTWPHSPVINAAQKYVPSDLLEN